MTEPIPLDEARARVLGAARALPAQSRSLADAAGHYLAEPVHASVSHPAADNSAMDGHAVRAGDTRPGVELDVVGVSRAGYAPTATVGAGQAVRIFTGGLLPAGADAVLIQEATEPADDGRVRCLGAAISGANIRRAGEEYLAGEELLGAGTRLSPAAVGLLASAGVAEVRVTPRPRLALAVIGDELSSTSEARAHRHDSNGPMLTAAGRELGLAVAPVVRLPDDATAVAAWLADAATTHDLVVTCGSASVGDHDVVAAAWELAGVAARFSRVAIKPGKPVRFGQRGDALFFALPGNPLACLTGFEQLVTPAVAALCGGPWQPPVKVSLPLATDVRTGHDALYLLRAGLREGAVAVPARQGAAMLREAATQSLVAELPGGTTLTAGTLVAAQVLNGALAGKLVRPVATPPALGVRGPGSNCGKTRLIEQLLPLLTARGVRVGTIKHTHHDGALDTPGKDSARHFAAGAARVRVVGEAGSATFERSAGSLADLLADFADCHLVLVEGLKAEPLPEVRIELGPGGFSLLGEGGRWRALRPEALGDRWSWPEELVARLAEELVSWLKQH